MYMEIVPDSYEYTLTVSKYFHKTCPKTAGNGVGLSEQPLYIHHLSSINARNIRPILLCKMVLKSEV
jgi:hypothetical protein